ncbi:MAG: hypothetical protein WC187_07880, partial [Bacillota bacterium]
MDRLPVRVKLIIGTTALLAIISGYYSLEYWQIENGIEEILFFILLSMAAESLSIALSSQIRVSVVFAMVICVIMLFNPLTAALIIATGDIFSIHYRKGKYIHIFSMPFYKTAFNASNIFLSSLIASIVYRALYFTDGDINLSHYLVPITLASLVYLAINASTVTLLVSNLQRISFGSIWNKNIKWTAKNYITMAPLG